MNAITNQSTRTDTSQHTRILFLCEEPPWPSHSGAALRTLGILKELCKFFEVELFLLTRQPISIEQTSFLSKLAKNIVRLPLRDTLLTDKLLTLPRMLFHGYPYHSAVFDNSFNTYPKARETIAQFPGIIFTNVGHWGSLVHNKPAPNWILNQCDADVEFWRAYAAQISHPLTRLAAQVNYRLARRHYPAIYANVGRIISVCEEDRQHTLALAPTAQVNVIENGIDCSHYIPQRELRLGPPRLLFTGTSAARNMTALHGFMKNVFPLIHSQLPNAELLVGGNFTAKAQAEFANIDNIRFTGRVDDMRPIYNQSDVFIAPFGETHGSKLKIAEAMAMGLPIVSTPMGIRGFPLVHGESVLIAYTPHEFAAHVVSLLQNVDHRLRLGNAARSVALATIDWKILGKRLAEIISAMQKNIDNE